MDSSPGKAFNSSDGDIGTSSSWTTDTRYFARGKAFDSSAGEIGTSSSLAGEIGMSSGEIGTRVPSRAARLEGRWRSG